MHSWQTKKLCEICDITRGGSPRPIQDYIVDNDEDGYPWLRIGDVPIGDRYIYKTSSKIKPGGLKKTTLVKKGDFILSNSMSFGRPYIMMTDACIHDGWLALRNIKSDLMDKHYLYYLLTSDYMQNEFLNYSAGSGVQNLKKETVKDIEYSAPDVIEQQRIVSVLETWDEYLELLNKKIALKERLKKGLMQQLLTGKKRLSGSKDEWSKEKIGNIANISKGKALSSSGLGEGDIPVIAGGQTSPYTHSHFTNENVITVSASGAYAGYVSYHPYKIWASDCNVIIEKEGLTDIHYLLHYLQFIQQKIYSLQTGGAQPHIYSKDLAILDIKIPSLEEQQAIANILDRVSNGVLLLNALRKEIELQKKYLLKNLITGKIRTPENLKIKEANNA